eukprot:2673298-Amphidinium_carterae.2
MLSTASLPRGRRAPTAKSVEKSLHCKSTARPLVGASPVQPWRSLSACAIGLMSGPQAPVQLSGGCCLLQISNLHDQLSAMIQLKVAHVPLQGVTGLECQTALQEFMEKENLELRQKLEDLEDQQLLVTTA